MVTISIKLNFENKVAKNLLGNYLSGKYSDIFSIFIFFNS